MNPYELLGVSPNATPREIKSAYRQKAKLYHPDVCSDKVVGERLFKELNIAYEMILSGKAPKPVPKHTTNAPPQQPIPEVVIRPVLREYYDYRNKRSYYEYWSRLNVSSRFIRRGGRVKLRIKGMDNLPPFHAIINIDKDESGGKWIDGGDMHLTFNNIGQKLHLTIKVIDL